MRPERVFGVVPNGSEKYFAFEGDHAEYSQIRVTDTKSKIAGAMGLKKWVVEDPIVKIMLDAGYPDEIFCVSDEDARAMANRLCQEEGIFCGMSSGANVAVALQIARRLGPGKNVVTTIVDRRDRYLSEAPCEKYVV